MGRSPWSGRPLFFARTRRCKKESNTPQVSPVVFYGPSRVTCQRGSNIGEKNLNGFVSDVCRDDLHACSFSASAVSNEHRRKRSAFAYEIERNPSTIFFVRRGLRLDRTVGDLKPRFTVFLTNKGRALSGRRSFCQFDQSVPPPLPPEY